jgi:hypothetical protein
MYHDFFEVLARGGAWKELLAGYLSPNRGFFNAYSSSRPGVR